MREGIVSSPREKQKKLLGGKGYGKEKKRDSSRKERNERLTSREKAALTAPGSSIGQ